MSLESDVSNLSTQVTALIGFFNGKKAAIDQAVAAAIAAVPDTSRTWWVDPVAGLDTNDGKSAAAAFKTIDKAIKSTPASGQCSVNLLNDYPMTQNIPVLCAYLVIYGVNAVASGVTPKMRPQYFQGSDNSTQLAGLIFYSQSSNVELRNVDIVLPSVAGQAPAPTITRVNSFFKTNAASSMPPILGIMLQSVVVTKAADFYGALVGISASVLSLCCYGVTFPSDMPGKYVSTVGAGVASNTLSQVVTNLTTL